MSTTPNLIPDPVNQLPVFSALESIVAAIRANGSAVITSPPGSGKTTLIPPALLDDGEVSGKILLLQPRRIAARAVARRIAHLRNVTLGGEIGYQVRFESAVSKVTRLIVETTGILLRRLIDDLSLPGVSAVVLDEFHERTIEQDLCLGALRRIQETIRPDLRIVVMSATLAAEPVARLLGNCPVIDVSGKIYPVEVRYLRRRTVPRLEELVAEALPGALHQTTGHVLVFLPGLGEIRACERAVTPLARRVQAKVFPLFGDQGPEDQDRALAPCDGRKLILATNIAETSLTIEGVTAVIDTGYARQNQMDPHVGLPKLVRVPISKASADQRAGRAGRLMPGICWRLWEAASHSARRDYDLPEVVRMDLASAVLTLLHWGESEIAGFPWLTAPTDDAIQSAFGQLRWLQAIDERRQLTDLGQKMVAMPLHPRLARLLLSGGQHGIGRQAAMAAALLSERDPFRIESSPKAKTSPSIRSDCDLCDRVQTIEAISSGQSAEHSLPMRTGSLHSLQKTAKQLLSFAPTRSTDAESSVEIALRKSILDAFPDRLAQLRPGSVDRGVMVGGKGVRLGPQTPVRPDRLFVCVELDAAGSDAVARLVTNVERDWLDSALIRSGVEIYFHPTRRQIESRRRNYWGDLLLEETPTPVELNEETARLLAKHASTSLVQILPDADSVAHAFRRKIQWLAVALPDMDLPRLDDDQIRCELPNIALGCKSFDELKRAPWLDIYRSMVGSARIGEIERLAPSGITVPSGNRISVTYEAGKPPILAVRIQELFGLAETPRIANGRIPLQLQLLGPNYRPQQITNDLASFWKNGYPEVKKELRRRYPKHAWPDDPLSASPSRSGLKRDQP